MRSFLWQRVTEISELTARSLRATATVNIIPGAPALINDVSYISLLKKAVFSHTIILNFRLMKMSYGGAALCFLKQHDRQPNFFPV
jgi:metal-dependent amidase/aminoacylase/carboxypeptidase family protein